MNSSTTLYFRNTWFVRIWIGPKLDEPALLDRGGQVKLLKPHQRFAELLAITRLDAVFEVHQQESAAIAKFNPSTRFRLVRPCRTISMKTPELATRTAFSIGFQMDVDKVDSRLLW